MQAELSAFLAAEDLDELLAARLQITSIDRAESAALSAIVQGWVDRQAVANLLMYPDVIPAPDRLPALLKALNDEETEYFVLAAVVGLQSLGEQDLPEGAGEAIATRLLELLHHPSPTIASRASVTLARYAPRVDVEDLLEALEDTDADETVRHNLLVMALSEVSPGNLRGLVQAKIAEGSLAPEVGDYVDEKLAEAGVDANGNLAGAAELIDTDLGAAILAPIPNFNAW